MNGEFISHRINQTLFFATTIDNDHHGDVDDDDGDNDEYRSMKCLK